MADLSPIDLATPDLSDTISPSGDDILTRKERKHRYRLQLQTVQKGSLRRLKSFLRDKREL